MITYVFCRLLIVILDCLVKYHAESLVQEVDFEGIEIVERHLIYIAEARETLLRASQQ